MNAPSTPIPQAAPVPVPPADGEATRTLDARRSVLVLVDYQARLMPVVDGADRVLAEALLLADAARLLGIPVVATEQNPAGLGPNVEAVDRLADHRLAKTHFDACRDGLDSLLARVAPDRPEVVIAGCEAHVCLMQTALGLRAAGRRVAVVAPACGSRRAADRAAGLARLQGAGALLLATEMAVFEWLGDCRHPAFRPVLARLKAHG